MNIKLSGGQLLSLAAAVLVLLCFFFPWIQLNLFLASVNLSGFQLASGSGPAGMNFSGLPSLFLVPLCMLGVLALVMLCFLGQSSVSALKSLAALLLMAGGGISSLIILYQYFNLNQQLNQDIVGMMAQSVFNYSFGAHASLLGSIGVLGGGLIDLGTGLRNLNKN